MLPAIPRLVDECFVHTEARARGASAFYGYPHLAPDDRDAERFCGPTSLYTELGFVPVGRTEYRQVVRLVL